MPLLLVTTPPLIQPLIYILKINRLTMEEMLGVKLKEKTLWLTVQLTPINSVMELYKVIPILTLEMEEQLVFLIWEAYNWFPNKLSRILLKAFYKINNRENPICLFQQDLVYEELNNRLYKLLKIIIHQIIYLIY